MELHPLHEFIASETPKYVDMGFSLHPWFYRCGCTLLYRRKNIQRHGLGGGAVFTLHSGCQPYSLVTHWTNKLNYQLRNKQE